jgi:DNA-binding transcriptional MerR regulator
MQDLFFTGSLMSQTQLTIGALSAQTSCNIPTIRYYEQIGLLPSPARATNGHRYYRETDMKRLVFIKRCRDFGFPIEQVRALVSLFEDGDRSCVEVRDMAQVHLDAVRVKMREMQELEASLTGFIGSCDATCSTGVTRNCAIVAEWSAPDAAPVKGCCAGASAPPQPAQFTAIARKRT